MLEDLGLQFIDMIAWVKPGGNESVPRHAHIKKDRHYFPSRSDWEAGVPCADSSTGKKIDALISNRVLYPDGTVNSYVER
jgi:hypothetical protein